MVYSTPLTKVAVAGIRVHWTLEIVQYSDILSGAEWTVSGQHADRAR